MWWMEQKDSRSYVNIHALWYHKEAQVSFLRHPMPL